MRNCSLLNFVILVVATIFITENSYSQSFLQRGGDRIVNEAGDTVLLRGMGLGGWMLQEGYMLQTAAFADSQWSIEEHIEELIGKEKKEEFYEAWYANHVTREDIDSMASWGFNLVRLPMHYNLFTLSIQEEPVENEHTWLEKGFEMTDSLVSWCKANDMYVLLDLHAAPGGQGYNQGISDYNPIYPSLWESNANKRKTIALWKQLAEHYADEPTIAGYDLLNEPNWNLPQNSALRALYGEITDAIREVDDKHLLFIEGNWFANDFTSLTIPWDDNMVYAPHKYWSNNETEDLSWVLDIREATGYPIFFGESGENSNVWFRDAIRNFENNGMGWAWWPEKKVESISGPLSVTKSPEYERLLNYWNGNGPKPFINDAIKTLMQLTEDLKIENCFYQKDVIDAMFRQVYSDETVPFNVQSIPGVVYASDYDMGRNGFAYYDTEYGNYELSTGEFTPWNSGWAYRNDGVDIENSSDGVNSNGYNIGFMEANEWMQYSVDVAEAGVYQAKVRYAAGVGTGKFHLESNNGILTESLSLGSTLGWSNWRTYTVEDIILTEADDKLIFHVDNEGFNLSSLEFVKVGELSDLETKFLCAETVDNKTIAVTVNKPLQDTDNITAADFSIIVNGNPFTVSSVLVEQNSKTFLVTIDNNFASSHIINLSYDGTAISAIDNTLLAPFSQRLVKNTVISYLPIPGLVEAENYYQQVGIELENTSDVGGGKNIGFLDVGDYADYYIDVKVPGTYIVDYRTASQGSTGELELFIVDGEEMTSLHRVSFQPTGDWQTWATTSKNIELEEGKHLLRMVINESMFNLNWMRFGSQTSTKEAGDELTLNIYPNPTQEYINILVHSANQSKLLFEIIDVEGRTVNQWREENLSYLNRRVDISSLSSGLYSLSVKSGTKVIATKKLVKI